MWEREGRIQMVEEVTERAGLGEVGVELGHVVFKKFKDLQHFQKEVKK